MNKNWSETNKTAQTMLAKKDTFEEGIRALLALRETLFGEIERVARDCPHTAFSEMPFPNAKGYHSKSVAYSLWHIFRIEDIVAHTLILNDAQVFFEQSFDRAIHAPITTTGNELAGDAIRTFSEALDIDALLAYCRAVRRSTDEMLRKLPFSDLRRRFTDADRLRLTDCGCVSTDENAAWLIDYWCGKDIAGLLKMPFSRHWIMHIEAMLRIVKKLTQNARKGKSMVAPCGLSCRHCFLKEQCGSCGTCYNICSFASESESGICPNAACSAEKGLEGCWQCAELPQCEKGFYIPYCSGANPAKAQCLYIAKHGKKAFLAAQDRLHEKYVFEKVQEVLGQDIETALKMLEEL